METKDSLVVNLFGGPGVGKSTTAADLFARLKWQGISCEFVPEWVKSKVYEESFRSLDDQLYVFAKQHHRMWVCKGKVDVIICDASLLNSLIYGADNTSETFKNLVLERYHSFRNLNVLIERNKPYDTTGRMQTLEEAHRIDERIRSMLGRLEIDYNVLRGGPERIETLVDAVQEKLEVPA